MDCIKEIEVDTEYNGTEKPVVVDNYFPYIGMPSNEYDSLESFYKGISDEIEKMNEFREEGEISRYDDVDKRMRTKVGKGIKYIYTTIDYPLRRDANFKFTMRDNMEVTYGMLMYIYSHAYQTVYKMEEDADGKTECIPGMFNRAPSNGPYGIWGHYIDDLCYNGHSDIRIYGDSVACYFECDS